MAPKTVVLVHDKVRGEATMPASAVDILRRSGWRPKDEKPQAATRAADSKKGS